MPVSNGHLMIKSGGVGPHPGLIRAPTLRAFEAYGLHRRSSNNIVPPPEKLNPFRSQGICTDCLGNLR